MDPVPILLAASVFCFGAIIGSFLNVVIIRLHTGKSLGGFSHCMTCRHRLRPIDLVPIISYLLSGGACRYCGARISLRYIVVESMTAALFLLAYSVHGLSLVLVPALILMSLLVVIAVYDIDHYIIPDEGVLFLGVVALIMLAISNPLDQNMLFFHGVSALASGFFFFALWKMSEGTWIGLGDAKLALPLGILLSPLQAFSFVVGSFWIGALIGGSFYALSHMLHRVRARGGKRPLRFVPLSLTMKSEVPFAPFLILSFLFVYYGGFDALQFVDGFATYLLP